MDIIIILIIFLLYFIIILRNKFFNYITDLDRSLESYN